MCAYSQDIRHVPVVNPDGDLVGMLSMKDLVREINREHDADMDTLSSFALGRGGHFVLD
jgi:Mg/Co/Ni transporter MgtE